ncbi:hypothetical protein MWN34_03570 [Ancylobacter sp. 6x-1]|uniref:Invasion associated locus B family protein n=1 Tax=Ancylobacter crimeensis TaxID=2579147 RepID=A0ABT0D7Q4_9HYPH|nr:hypothetical protein [Ancylobacter crimeensis]MCK0195985.1 hypothetical protein [Ancylobacter crimeensis]
MRFTSTCLRPSFRRAGAGLLLALSTGLALVPGTGRAQAAAAQQTQQVAARDDAKPVRRKSKKGKDTAKEAVKPKPAGVWNFSRDGEAVLLQFRMPGAPTPTLVAICRPQAALFQIVAEVSPPKAQTGDAIRLLASAGKSKVEFAASVFPSVAPGRKAVETQVRLEPKLVQLFSAGEQLRLAAPGTVETVPLLGADKAVAAFSAACVTPGTTPAPATTAKAK